MLDRRQQIGVLLGVFVLATMATSCGPKASFYPKTVKHKRAPTSVDSVEIFYQWPDRECAEIGVLKIQAKGYGSGPDRMIEVLRERAASVGADAVVWEALTTKTVTSGSWGKKGGQVYTGTRDIITAVAVIWK